MSRGLGDVYKRQIQEYSLSPNEYKPVSYTHLTLPTILLV
ncbi:hypothetical protein JMUB7528_28690 [Staphylococcus aureus]